MLEGKQLILATKPYARENRSRSWQAMLSTLLLLVASIAATAWVPNPWLRLLLGILSGLLLVRMFSIYHDFLHKSLLKGSIMARLLFTIYGFYTLNAPSIWQRSHNYHHKHNSKLYTSSIGSFPIVTLLGFKNLKPLQRFQYLFVRHPLTILFGYVFAFWYGMSLLSLTRNPRKHWDSAVGIVVHGGAGVLFYTLGGAEVFFFAFLLPAMLSSALGSYLFYAQHNFPGATFRTKEEWTYHEAALESSSLMTMNPVLRWFMGNIGYHHIHHINALIPFYRLPEVHAAFQEFQNAKTTPLTPLGVYRCLRLKIWDPELNRMLSLAEARSQMRKS